MRINISENNPSPPYVRTVIGNSVLGLRPSTWRHGALYEGGGKAVIMVPPQDGVGVARLWLWLWLAASQCRANAWRHVHNHDVIQPLE